VSLWALVISQARQISRLQARTKNPNIAVYDNFDDIVKRGDAMMERYMKSEAPPGEEFYQWDNELIAMANLHCKLSERNRLRGASVMDMNAQGAMHIGRSQNGITLNQRLFTLANVGPTENAWNKQPINVDN
jgi:hypothetical protein